MNHVYDQEYSTCAAFAVCNAMEEQMGVSPTKEAVHKYFKARGWNKSEGIRSVNLLVMLRDFPLCGVKIKDYECIFNRRWHNGSKKRYFMSNVRNVMAKDLGKIIFSVKVRDRKKGQDKFELDKSGYYIPRKTKIVSHHAMYCPKTIKEHVWSFKSDFLLENSWGKDWGINGYMKMRLNDVYEEVQLIHKINFEYA